ncbi:MAG TPA: holo-ACP synthase [Thermodesulfovibrionales bacterium]|nr:holo-ACP synthase [Thermodesulfovibrionales bacterium]
MIYGIGTDIVKVERMKEVVEKWGEKFLQRVFTPHEIAYCHHKYDPFPSLSVRFAAKEAVIKASGSWVSIPLVDIEVVNDERGNPTIQPRGALEVFFRDSALSKVHLSLSHEKEYGIAFVVLEGQDIR